MSNTQPAPLLMPEPSVRALLDPRQVRRYRAVPLGQDGGALIVAMENPRDLAAVEEIEFLTGRRLRALGADAAAIERAIETHYGVEVLPVRAGSDPSARAETPVVGLQRFVLGEAVRLGASDIHIDPAGRASQVRYRIDGHMVDAFQIPKWLHHRLVARIKVMARLDISEQRRPQDGHLDDPAHGVEARLSTLPTWRGEAVVLRLFGDRGELPSLGRIGCSPGIRDQLLAIGHQPQGVLLVTGPTGSGKTTTLYAVLNDLRHQPLNIVTIEDPVEYRVDGVRQVQVDDRTGLSFESALRSTLRQDPDVILVGEIRDAETARIAFHAGLTGHLVLSTLHATEAVAVLSRLSELGVSRGVVASTLVGVVAQRLVRRNCSQCLEPDPAPPWLLTRMRVSREEAGGLKRSRGCTACGWSGASRRIAVFEVLEPDREFRRAVLGGRDEDLRAAAATAGLAPISRQARDLVLSGEVAIREAYRTCHFGELG